MGERESGIPAESRAKPGLFSIRDHPHAIPLGEPEVDEMLEGEGFPSETMAPDSVQSQLAVSPAMSSAQTGQRSVT